MDHERVIALLIMLTPFVIGLGTYHFCERRTHR